MSNKKIFKSIRFEEYQIFRIHDAMESTGLNFSEVVRTVFTMIRDNKIRAYKERLTEDEQLIWENL